MSEGWQTAFVAVSVAMGEPVDDALASLGPSTTLSPRAEALVSGLRSSSRADRARSLAQALSEVALEVEAMGLS